MPDAERAASELHEAESRYDTAAGDYTEASTLYEVAAMSGDLAALEAADGRLAVASRAYGEALDSLVVARRRAARQGLPSFEEILRHPWTQPDREGAFAIYADVAAQSAGLPIERPRSARIIGCNECGSVSGHFVGCSRYPSASQPGGGVG